MIQKIVVHQIDEELGRGAVRVTGAGHGNGAALVFQAIVGLVFHSLAGGLFVHARAQTAALNHEAGDHAVKDGIFIKAVVHILQKIGHGFGGLVLKKFNQDIAGRGFQQHGGISHACSLIGNIAARCGPLPQYRPGRAG